MKLKHNVPASAYRSDPVTPEYQAEVDRSTDKAMVAWRRAQRRLEAAERRHLKAKQAVARSSSRTKARELAVAAELVELRREELLAIEALMKAAPAAAQYRGNRSFRPIPKPGGTL